LDDFLSGTAEVQRCTWNAPRRLYHALWEDGLKKKDGQPQIDKVKQLVGIELPAGDFQILREKDKEPVRTRYEKSKNEVQELISTFYEKGYQKGAAYLESLSKRLFTNIELWLSTVIIAPETKSLPERVFREMGRRLKGGVTLGTDLSDRAEDPLFPEPLYTPGSSADPCQPWKQNTPWPRNVAS